MLCWGISMWPTFILVAPFLIDPISEPKDTKYDSPSDWIIQEVDQSLTLHTTPACGGKSRHGGTIWFDYITDKNSSKIGQITCRWMDTCMKVFVFYLWHEFFKGNYNSSHQLTDLEDFVLMYSGCIRASLAPIPQLLLSETGTAVRCALSTYLI